MMAGTKDRTVSSMAEVARLEQANWLSKACDLWSGRRCAVLDEECEIAHP